MLENSRVGTVVGYLHVTDPDNSRINNTQSHTCVVLQPFNALFMVEKTVSYTACCVLCTFLLKCRLQV